MKKLGFIAASMGTAVLLAVGAAGFAQMVTHPGEVVEEANAAEIVRSGAREAAHAAGGGAFSVHSNAEVAKSGGVVQRVQTRAWDDDDDDDDDD
jgi:hypothetical protein